MKANTEYNKKIAKTFHDTKYYENAEFFTKNIEYIDKEKERLKTEKDEFVSILIETLKRYANKENKDNKIFYILEKIYIKNKNYAFSNHKVKKPDNSDLLNILASPALLTVSYNKVRKNKGANTKAATLPNKEYDSLEPEEKSWTNKTVDCPDGISYDLILITSKLIKENRYPWGCSRRIYIDKPGKKDVKRPITIPPFMDKVVQEALTTLLNVIYEPHFERMNRSFGFRPNKGVHDAINSLTNANNIGLNMALEGDIKSAYDKVNRKILINILSEKINDRKLIKFIEKRLDYIYFDNKDNKFIRNKEGLPQGGIDSPYLWNIYMSKFDEFIVHYIKELFEINKNNKKVAQGNRPSGPRRKLDRQRATINSIIRWINNKNDNISDKAEILRKMQLTNGKDLKNYLDIKSIYYFKETAQEIEIHKEKDIRKIKYKLIKLQGELQNKGLKLESRDSNRIKLRFTYTRYADDWIILTNAKREMIEKIKSKITSFLDTELHASLSQEKTLITNINKESAHFLGFEIKTYNSLKIGTYTKIINGKQRKIKAITAGHRVFAIPDRQRLIDRFHMKGYCDTKGNPREVGFLTKLEDFTIIDRYNAVISGLTNYYAEFIKTPKKNLSRWIYILRYSCIKTLAQKHKTSVKKIFKKYRAPKNKDSKENTIMSKVYNTVDNITYEKTWTLLTTDIAIKRAKNLRIKEKVNDIFWSLENGIPIEYENSNKCRITNDDFYNKLNWINVRTISSFEMPCSICGSDFDVEMHHINHVRKNKYTTIDKELTWQQIMSLRNRKQIPVCRECHFMLIHKGKYGGQKLSKFCPKIMLDNRIISIESFINKKQDKPFITDNFHKSLQEKGWTISKSNTYKKTNEETANPPIQD